jgi:formamidopyrimidine-DNA glycosylase
MPELPEVESVLQSLAPKAQGQRIRTVQMLRRDLRYPVPEDLGDRLTGRLIQRLDRRGKYLVFVLGKGDSLLIHLGMSGRLLWQGLDQSYFRHVAWRMHLANGESLAYADARRFGFVRLLTAEENDPLSFLGVEPLSRELNRVYLAGKMGRSQRSIKELIMDQSLLAGIGNIYANEILFCAGIHPLRPGSALVDSEWSSLARCIKKVLREAIRFQGSSISDFLDSRGKMGRFQKRFAVYARAGNSCRHCGKVIVKKRHHNRSYYYCPRCQLWQGPPRWAEG